jgi:molybdopterin molybdotransferase
MLNVAEALAAVLANAAALPPVGYPLVEARGCVLAEDVIADADSPPFDKALVDGYAVRSGDLHDHDRRLTVGETIMAGQMPSRPLEPGEAAVIMTGAPLPIGCDAVVMHERTQADASAVLVLEPGVRPGQNLLHRGREMRAGQVVLAKGTILEPARLGLLATVGRTLVAVVPRPLVAILPTGDELVEPGQVPGPGQIRNSNAVMLDALAIEAGARTLVLPIVPDEAGLLGRALESGLLADVLIVTGGVSAGQRDLVPAALGASGVERIFHKVRLKPGKPLWFGIGPPRGERPGALVFGLPGNPVSGLVGFVVFVRAALAVLAGKPEPRGGLTQARLETGFAHRGDRTTFFPARVVERGSGASGLPVIESLPWAGSADLRTASAADGFAVFPAGDRDYAAGEVVDFLPMR